MKRLCTISLGLLMLFPLAGGAAWASSDDGYSVRIADTTIEVRIGLGDPHYRGLFQGIARHDHIFFTLMRWMKANEDRLGAGGRVVLSYLRSDRAGNVTFTMTENDKLQEFTYPDGVDAYQEAFFTDILNAWFGFKVTRPLPDAVTFVAVSPIRATSFEESVYGYSDVWEGALPGAYMLDADGKSFFACFQYKNIDQFLSDHLGREFAVKKIVIDRKSIGRYFRGWIFGS